MISAHGGTLVERFSNDIQNVKRYTIDERYISDCEMIGIGGFSPLEGFMGKADAISVIDNMKLQDGTLWSIPVLLPLPDNTLKEGEAIILQDSTQTPIAQLEIEEIFTLDLNHYVKNVYGTADKEHPGVDVVYEQGNTFVGGKITLLNLPTRTTISQEYYLTPKQTRELFKEKEFSTVVAFQTRNPIHRAHEHIIKAAMEPYDAALIHPLVGATKADDIPEDVRMECYETLLNNYFNKEKALLSVLPAAMRYAGPREAIHHLIIRQNYGCTHMIIGRDHAGVGDYYGTYAAQELVKTIKDHLEITPVFFEHAFYCTTCETLATQHTCPHETRVHLSGTKVRELLRNGEDLPKEFTRKEVADVLKNWILNSS